MDRKTADAARVVAMAAVLAIHATQAPANAFAQDVRWWSGDALAALLNQLARFCVPLFVALSGLALAARERSRGGDGRVSPFPFWGGRLWRIGLPYLVWSLVYRLVDAPWQQGAGGALWTVARNLPGDLLCGGAQYHLYFIPIILQCYLLFPLLVRLRSVWWTVGLFALALFYASPTHVFISWRPEAPSYLFPFWLAWFHLGIRVGLDPRPAAGRGWAVLALAVAAIGVAGEWWWWSRRLADPGWFGHFHRWTVVAYGLACWWALRAWNTSLAAWLASPGRSRVLGFLSGISFAVYLAHPLLLRAMGACGCPGHPLIAIPVLALASAAAVWLLDRLLRPLPGVAAAVGCSG